MRKRVSKPFVRVCAVAVAAVVGCERPETKPETPTTPSGSPSAGRLRTWDEVESGHPEGATNPPSPVLGIATASGKCVKTWEGGLAGGPEDVIALIVGSTRYDARHLTADPKGGTPIVCPDGTVEAMKKYLAQQAAASATAPSASSSAAP